jgi:integrase
MAWIVVIDGKRGRRYKVGWREPNKAIRYKTFRRRVDAEAHRHQVEASKLEGTYVNVSASKITVEEFADRYLSMSQSQLQPSTFARYESLIRLYIVPKLGSKKLSTLSAAGVRDFLTDLQKAGHSDATLNHVHRVLRAMLTIAVQEGRLPRNPAERLRVSRSVRKEPRFLTPEEVARIADEVPPRYRALTLLLAYGGLRIGEALALRMKNVKLLESRVQIVESVTEVGGHRLAGGTKTGRSRTVSLPPFLRDALADHLARFGSPKDPDALAFTVEGGEAVRLSNYRNRVFHPACRRADILPLPRVHDLRHTAVAIAIKAGAHPMQIKEMVGHSSITVTFDVYGHLFDTLHSRTGDAIDAIFRSAEARRPPEATVVDLRARKSRPSGVSSR